MMNVYTSKGNIFILEKFGFYAAEKTYKGHIYYTVSIILSFCFLAVNCFHVLSGGVL